MALTKAGRRVLQPNVPTYNSFYEGGVANVFSDVFLHKGIPFMWEGSLPKTVPMGATPMSAGGIGTGKWNNGLYTYLQSLGLTFDTISDIGLVLDDQASSQDNINKLKQWSANGGKHLHLHIDSDLYLDSVTYKSDLILVDNIMITGNGTLHVKSGDYFTIRDGGSSFIDGVRIVNEESNIQRGAVLVKTRSGVNSKIKFVSQTNTKCTGYIRPIMQHAANSDIQAYDSMCDYIDISRNTFTNTDDCMIQLINTSYVNFSFKYNFIKNMKGCFLFDNVVNESANFWDIMRSKHLLEITGNIVDNPELFDAVMTQSESSYIALAVVKNYKVVYDNNKVLNLTAMTNPSGLNIDGVYDLYMSSEYTVMTNNLCHNRYNFISGQKHIQNCALKVKTSPNIYIDNHQHTYDSDFISKYKSAGYDVESTQGCVFLSQEHLPDSHILPLYNLTLINSVIEVPKLGGSRDGYTAGNIKLRGNSFRSLTSGGTFELIKAKEIANFEFFVDIAECLFDVDGAKGTVYVLPVVNSHDKSGIIISDCSCTSGTVTLVNISSSYATASLNSINLQDNIGFTSLFGEYGQPCNVKYVGIRHELGTGVANVFPQLACCTTQCTAKYVGAASNLTLFTVGAYVGITEGTWLLHITESSGVSQSVTLKVEKPSSSYNKLTINNSNMFTTNSPKTYQNIYNSGDFYIRAECGQKESNLIRVYMESPVSLKEITLARIA